MTDVIVVTGLDLEWDCIVGVFASEEAVLNSWLAEAKPPLTTYNEVVKHFKGDYVFHENTLEK